MSVDGYQSNSSLIAMLGLKEGLSANLRDKEKEQHALEEGFARANESLSAEKVLHSFKP